MQQFWQGHHAFVEVTLVTGTPLKLRWYLFCHAADASDVVIRTRHEHGARWRASRCSMKISQSQTRQCECIEMGRMDFATEGAEVGEAKIVGDDDQNIGAHHAK